MTTVDSQSPSLSSPVVAPGRPAWKKIVACFGDGVLDPSGVINREALGALIFKDESKRKLLNSCTHPFIQRAMLRQALLYFLQGVSLTATSYMLSAVACVHVCVYVCVYVCMYVCAYIYASVISYKCLCIVLTRVILYCLLTNEYSPNTVNKLLSCTVFS